MIIDISMGFKCIIYIYMNIHVDKVYSIYSIHRYVCNE